jgi:hypothetical protein
MFPPTFNQRWLWGRDTYRPPDEPIRTTEAVGDLVNDCRKRGPLYRRHPRAVAQVNRTAKWLLNALATLRRQLEEPGAPQ